MTLIYANFSLRDNKETFVIEVSTEGKKHLGTSGVDREHGSKVTKCKNGPQKRCR